LRYWIESNNIPISVIIYHRFFHTIIKSREIKKFYKSISPKKKNMNGAAVMDASLLLVASNEICPQPQTSEH
jgi:hypothetical protein